MKNLITVSLMALMTAGCVWRITPGIDESRSFIETPKPTSKVALECSDCDEDNLKDYFIKGNKDSRHCLPMVKVSIRQPIRLTEVS